MKKKQILLFVAFLAGALWAVGQTNDARVEAPATDVPIVSNDAPVEARVLRRPAAFAGSDHRLHVAYEIHLAAGAAASGPLTVKSLSVFRDSSASPIATFSNEQLMGLLNSEETPETGTDLVIRPGKRVVLFIWLSFSLEAVPPRSLHHTIDFLDDHNKTHTLAGVLTDLDQAPVLVLGAPVRGHIWLIDEGPGNPKSHHWGSLLPQDGMVTIPQRFAIDFFGLDNAGHAVVAAPGKLNQTSNSQWTGYGAEVLAVQDGVVRDMRDSLADHAPLAPLPEPTDITARGLYGNFIVLEIGPHIFAHYAHLQHGSILVHVGQHVKKGDVVARLGDSGNAGGPHLHFHVTDKPTFELSEGIPFVFSTFELLGKTDEGKMLDPGSTLLMRPSAKKNVLPLNGEVVRF